MKYVIGAGLLAMAIFLGIVTKTMYDEFTNATGILPIVGANAETIALFGMIPWALPLLIFIIVIIMTVKSDGVQR